MDIESLEESLDSIPRPEYEAIEAHIDNKNTHTPLAAAAQRKDKKIISNDAITAWNGGEEEQEEEISINDEEMEEEEENELNNLLPAEQMDVNEIEDDDDDDSVDVVYNDNAKVVRIQSEKLHHGVASNVTAAPVAIKIVGATTNTPKLLTAKTKNNKLVMVQLVDGSGKAIPPIAVNTTTTVAATANAAALSPVVAINTTNINLVSKSTPNEKKSTATTPIIEDKSTQQQSRNVIRSSTPLSREFLALQRSVNESKILSEFVTDTAVVKARKLRKAGTNTTTPTTKDNLVDQAAASKQDTNSAEKLQKFSSNQPNSKSNGTAQEYNATERRLCHSEEYLTNMLEAANTNRSQLDDPLLLPVVEKIRKPSKFIPLKDESSNSDVSDVKIKNRSRSKSVRRQSTAASDSDMKSSSNRSRSKSVNRKSPVPYNDELRRWPSDERLPKRTNMRSQNSEFVQKQMDFLNRVIHQQGYENSVSDADDEYEKNFALNEGSGVIGTGGADDEADDSQLQDISLTQQDISQGIDAKLLCENIAADAGNAVNSGGGSDANGLETHLKSIWQPPPKRGWDSFCWKCRECGNLFSCTKCLRCFHASCIKMSAAAKLDNTIICPECTTVEHMLNGSKRMRRNELSLELLSQLLSFALKRMRNVKGSSAFFHPNKYINKYNKYIVNPVTFDTLQEKIEKKVFRCAEEFVNESKWILHNSYILSAGVSNSKEILTAKAILKNCRQEANEIDTCAECYLNANTSTAWFVDVCPQPHLLLWAKLKGFPYWPAKAMGLGQGSHVNVRFFGEHDRAFVPVKDCFLYSEQDPNTQTGKRSARELADCIKEVEVHIEKIRAKVGAFKYATYKTPYEPAEELLQLEQMMPGVGEYMKRQQTLVPKQSLQFKIVKTADNHLSIIKKASALETGNDSDQSSSPSKHKQLENNDNAMTTTTKYEVISKTTSDDSNSSKVSTVILKRKSHTNNNEQKKSTAEVELPMPKITKIEDNTSGDEQKNLIENKSMSSSSNSGGAKRKHGTDLTSKEIAAAATEHEKQHKLKHAKHEARVPLLSLKTNGGKVEATKEQPTEAAAAAAAAPTATTSKATTENRTQSVVENLVKNKQGVTIKKITKDVEKKKATTNAEATAADKSKNPTEKVAVNKTAEQQTKEKAAKGIFVLKDLVPFVEIKEEKLSDNEEAEKKHQNAAKEKATTAAAIVASGTVTGTTTTTTTTPTAVVAAVAAATSSPATKTTQEPPTNTATPEIPALLTTVKQEIMSDEEEFTDTVRIDPNISNSKTLQNDSSDKAATHFTLNTNANNNNSNKDMVRVVGDTTIQRLSAKTTTQNVPQTHAGNSNNNSASSNNNNNISSHTTNISKRSSTRGVPYGPLPAWATANSKTSSCSNATTNVSPNNLTIAAVVSAANVNVNANANTNLQNLNAQREQQQLMHQQRQGQRARKSFPNRSPPGVSPVRTLNSSNSAAPAALALATTSQTPSQAAAGALNADVKRSFLKATSMVAIPVDVANNRNNNSSNPPGNNSIPVPPLTAVSKTVPSTTTAASSASAIVPSNVYNPTTTTTATTAFASCNAVGGVGGGAVSSSNSNGSIIGTSCLLTPLTMSAPPPLAGLSQTLTATATTTAAATSLSSTNTTISSSNSSLLVPVVSSSNGLPESPNTTASAATAEAHLLGDFVTPTLASAITDMICRSTPKMTPRPSGPLRSEGSVMFPSQAGPVCRTLVENAHKLTDFFISVMEDTMCEMSIGEQPVLQAKITLLTMELERTKQTYEQEIAELKRTSDLMLCEMRKSMENEKTRLVNEIRKQCELERLRSVEDAKKKQWCANCGREAQFYCCWNTSYCDYPCQQLHWSRHAANCAQTRPSNGNDTNMALATSTATTVIGGMNQQQQQQQERLHGGSGNKSVVVGVNNNTGSTNASNAHYNKTVINSNSNLTGSSSGGSSSNAKKDKNISNKNSTTLQAMNVTPPAEVLKLPSNTYLRALPPNGNNSSSRNPYAAVPVSVPVHHFNISLPITTPVNTGPPYTIVQRGSTIELMGMSSAIGNNNASQTNITAALATPTMTTQTSQQQHQRMVSNQLPTKGHSNAAGGSGRNRSAANLACNATTSSLQCNVLRPTQM